MTDLLAHVRAGGLLAPGEPVLVLLSGGQDSVCLLDVAVRLVGAGPVAALHCNYGLRDGAAGDEAHCAALCSGSASSCTSTARGGRPARTTCRPGRARRATPRPRRSPAGAAA